MSGTSSVRVLLLAGTRPEVLKLTPLWRALENERAVITATFATLEQQPDLIGLAASDLELHLDRRARAADGPAPAASLEDLEGRAGRLLSELAPDVVVVQGDTNSALAAARAARARGLPLAHVEAGLRSGDLAQPFPEERNRIEITGLATVHYAPTARARANLESSGVRPADVLVTGNTSVDLLLSRRPYARDPAALWSAASRRIVVTTHRRESHGAGIRSVCAALLRLVESRPGVTAQFVLHPNPNASDVPRAMLEGVPGCELLPPQAHSTFLGLLGRALFAITDSGGIQEEAPYLGLPLLVTRAVTERPEAVEAGTAQLVGTDPEVLLAAAHALLDDRRGYLARARSTMPFGDGRAAERIAADLSWRFGPRATLARPNAPSAPALRRFLISPHVLRPDGRLLSWHNPAHPGHPYPEAAALALCALRYHAPGSGGTCERIGERLWQDRGPLGGYGKLGREYAFDTAIVARAFLALAETSGQREPWAGRARELLLPVREALGRRSAFLDPAAPATEHWSGSFGCHLLKCALAFRGEDEEDERVLDALFAAVLALQSEGAFRIHAGSATCYVHAHLYALEGLLHLSTRGWEEARAPLAAGAECLARWQGEDGALPSFAAPADRRNAAGGEIQPRADSTAQAIRIWLGVDGRRYADRIRGARAFLAHVQTPNGGLRYSNESMDENTWCSAFALQAEAWAERGRAEPAELF